MSPKKEKDLIMFNGRGYCCRKFDDELWAKVNSRNMPHAYVAAYSRADARKAISEYCGNLPSDNELKDYWSKGCWGDSMAGVTIERGVWIQFDEYKPPVRVY